MQITVASLPVKVVVMNIARRLLRATLLGATLIGVAPFVFSGSGTDYDRTRSILIPSADARAASHMAHHPVLKKKPKMIKVWKFVQRSTHGQGILLVGENAVKCSFVDQNVSWISSAPTWNVCIYNHKKKLGMLQPLGYCIVREDNKIEYGLAKLTSTSATKFMHQPALKLSYSVTSSDPVKEKTEMFFQTGSERAVSFSKLEMLFSNWFPVNPQVLHVINGITRMPGRGVLLEESHVYPGGRREVVLTTGSFTQCEVPETEFAYPKDFKVATLRDIMQERQKAREMSGVLQDLFLDVKKK
jgi:hypothetical protein